MYKIFLTIILSTFIISSCSNSDNYKEETLDNKTKQAIVNKVKVEEKWLWDTWNTWEEETIWGFTN